MKRSLFDGKYRFDFSSNGFFLLVNPEGEPLYDQALPYFEKLISHLVWIFFWLMLVITSHFLPPLPFLDYTFMGLIFLHLFFFGSRLTTLLLLGGLKPILFPPLWVRITRKLQKGAGLELLKKHHLHTHPGLLTNLALFSNNPTHLLTALTYAPDHPHLLTLLHALEKPLTHISSTD
jgi:hypothetical protein